MSDLLPEFRYHPRPIETKSVVASDVQCMACGRSRGFVYAASVFAPEGEAGALCPWCIADGSAARLFEVEFVDPGYDVPRGIAAEVLDELMYRTPGFCGWQQERWLFHCGDGTAFCGIFGSDELRGFPEAIQALRIECRESGWSEQDADAYLASLRIDRSPSAYVFRCLRCRRCLAYSDFI